MKRIVLVSMMCLVAIASTAQGISGRVIDEQAQPMPFANVVLVSRADSAFIAGVVTKDDGTFSISTDKQDGLLKVTSVGYTTKFLDARTGNVGDIQMQPDTQMLGEVVVKGSRPLVKMKDDALVTTVEGSYLSKTGTASFQDRNSGRRSGQDSRRHQQPWWRGSAGPWHSAHLHQRTADAQPERTRPTEQRPNQGCGGGDDSRCQIRRHRQGRHPHQDHPSRRRGFQFQQPHGGGREPLRLWSGGTEPELPHGRT